MKKVLSILLLGYLMPLLCLSQTYWITKTDYFSFLYHLKKSEIIISKPNVIQRYLPILDPHLRNYSQKILKNQKGLFILLDGTGQIYKATAETENQIGFTRQDSTYFIGYNGENYNFSYKDTLYSLGGVGFWKLNGQLRYFSEEISEWNILKVNKEYPVTDYVINYLPEKSTLFFVCKPYDDAATFDKITNYSVVQLDLHEKKNSFLGHLNKKFTDLFNKSEIEPISINLASLNGTLIYFDTEEQYLLNFEKKCAYRLNNSKIKDLFFRKSGGNIPINCFELNDKIYYQFPNDTSNSLKSIPISKNDFSKEPIEFIDNDEAPYNFLSTGLLTALLLIGGSYIIIRNLKKSEVAKKVNDPNSVNIDFNELEKNLINFLIEKSNNNIFVSVEELNFSLGISRKTLEIQKRTRTETIHRINHKFRLIFEIENDFIDRVRSEDDKRYYNYIINKENAALYKERFKK